MAEKTYFYRATTPAREGDVPDMKISPYTSGSIVSSSNKLSTLKELVDNLTQRGSQFYSIVLYDYTSIPESVSQDKNPVRYVSEKAANDLALQTVKSHLEEDTLGLLWDVGRVPSTPTIDIYNDGKWITVMIYAPPKGWRPSEGHQLSIDLNL